MVDLEAASRTVLLMIRLSGSSIDFQTIVESWHKCFDLRVPSAIAADGYETLFAANAALPFMKSIFHLNSIFHLFDQNVKDSIHPLVLKGDPSLGWPLFQKGHTCGRDTMTEEELESLWKALTDQWLLIDEKSFGGRKCLHDYVSSKIRHWVVAFSRVHSRWDGPHSFLGMEFIG